RLHTGAPPRDVKVEDPVEVLRAVDDHRMIDGLAGLRGAAAARRHRHLLRAADFYRAFGFLYRARENDAERHDRIMRGVGGITPTGESAEIDLAHLGFEAPFQSGQ